MRVERVTLQKIVAYCDKIAMFMDGLTHDAFVANDEKKYAVCLALLQ